MHRALRHMSWANQKVYASFATLPDEALDAYITNPEWTARHLLQHIVSGSDWYVYCLGIAPWNEPNAASGRTTVSLLLRMNFWLP